MKKAGEIISALFNENFGPEFLETAKSNAGLFSSWAEIVTEAWSVKSRWQNMDNDCDHREDGDVPAADHSWIKDLKNGQIIVEADHPGWIQILQTKKAEIIKTAKRKYPELGINNISFRLNSKPV